MNVPSLKVLDGIGFDAAIQTASRMLGVTNPAEIEARFPRYYPLGLGVLSVAPLEMARAFATFPNGGREVVPIGNPLHRGPQRQDHPRAREGDARGPGPQG